MWMSITVSDISDWSSEISFVMSFSVECYIISFNRILPVNVTLYLLSIPSLAQHLTNINIFHSSATSFTVILIYCLVNHYRVVEDRSKHTLKGTHTFLIFNNEIQACVTWYNFSWKKLLDFIIFLLYQLTQWKADQDVNLRVKCTNHRYMLDLTIFKKFSGSLFGIVVKEVTEHIDML